jgi:hypothetical protein
VNSLEILRQNIQAEMEGQHDIDDNVQVLLLDSLENHRDFNFETINRSPIASSP